MTFSIVARDNSTGAFGVATATGGPAVGSLVPYVRAGVGAVATQGTTNPLYGFEGLERLAKGESAGAVVAALTAADPDRGLRQCLMVGANAAAAAWSGEAITPQSGQIVADGVGVAGNMLADAEVLEAMMAAYRQGSGDKLEDRLLAALEAGQAAGGDRRGTSSAALRVVTTERYPAVDLRADLSETPITALAEILAAVRAPSYADFFRTLPTENGSR